MNHWRKLPLREVRARCHKPNYATLPWYGRRVSHPLSTIVVWLLYPTRVTPDQVTAASGAIVAGALVVALAGTDAAFLGCMLLLQAAYILDSVDGQLARLRGRTSMTGQALDIHLNALSVGGPFLFLAIGLSRQAPPEARDGVPWILVAGAVAALAGILRNALFDAGHAATVSRIARTPDGVRPVPPPPSPGFPGTPAAPPPPSAARRAFSLLHSLCVNPQVMNLLTVAAIIGCLGARPDLARLPLADPLLPPSWRGPAHPVAIAIVGYALALTTVWLALAYAFVRERKFDREFEERFRG